MDKYENMTKEELISELKNLRKIKYGLVWTEQLEEFEEESKNKIPILKQIEEFNLLKNDEKNNHLLIEGDNYHSLSCLNYTHSSKVDVIYIDPPYNTGNNDFIYRDNFNPKGKAVEREDPFRHSKWLSFISKRLQVAKSLLSDKGIIFISIDDNELYQLKLLCDNIFGEKNFVANIVWKCRSSMQYSEPLISSQTEYVLVYVKNRDLWNVNSNLYLKRIKKEMDSLNYSNPDNDSNGSWTSSGIIRDDGRKKYTVVSPNGTEFTEAWLYTEENMKKLNEEGKLWWGVNGNAKPRKKNYWKDYEGKVSSNLLMDEFLMEKTDTGYRKKKIFEVGTTEKGTKEVKEIFNDKRFPYPKPVSLVKYLISLYPFKDAIVLDFFAGSGTTGHAVLELNKEDGGNRKFILCTNNENNICREITYERVKRVISNYEDLKGNLFYFKTEFIGKNYAVNAEYNDRILLAQNVGDFISIKEDTPFKILENKFYQVYSNGEKFTAVYFQEDKSKMEEFKKIVEEHHSKVSIYIYSETKKEYDSEFSHLQDVTTEEIPSPILEIYKHIYKTIQGGEKKCY